MLRAPSAAGQMKSFFSQSLSFFSTLLQQFDSATLLQQYERVHYCNSMEKGIDLMTVKLFDSELKIMNVLWKEGDITAKEISTILADEVGWNMNTTYTVSAKNRTFCVMRLFRKRKCNRLKLKNWWESFSTALRISSLPHCQDRKSLPPKKLLIYDNLSKIWTTNSPVEE